MTVAPWTDEPEAPTGLAVWAGEARAAAALSASLALTAFVPQSLRVYLDSPRNSQLDQEATTATVTAALLTGREVGLSPMASLRSIDVVHGTPALRAIALRGLVLARGHDMWLIESTTTRAIMRGQRKGSPHVQEVTWGIQQARDLGIAGRPQWRQQPAAMLVARATAALARLIAPEALLGLPYVVEELDDQDFAGAGLSGDEPTEARPRRRTAKRTVRPVVESQLPPDPAPAAEPDVLPPDTAPQPEPAMVTGKQLTALHTALTVSGIEDRNDRLAYVRAVIDRDVQSSKELTYAEASRVLDVLAEQAAMRAQEFDGDVPDPPDDQDE